ncbi:unnamed protein product [Clavelina lepadiformis]|uniref:EGF-like domain-containing protein n=1 Tax=Clavelina lepadiformis TaxID=159417 RepID=A0ABP0FPK7_CLALP
MKTYHMCEDESIVDCHVNAFCYGDETYYNCKCMAGYIDRKPGYPGRDCVQEGSLSCPEMSTVSLQSLPQLVFYHCKEICSTYV